MIGHTAVAWPNADDDARVVGARTYAAPVATVAFYGLVLLAIAAPFETQAPLVALPWQSISNVEACILVAVAAWGVALAAARARPVWRTPLTWPWLICIAVLAIASALSPISRMNAFHMTGRLAAAFVIFLLTVNAFGGLEGRVRVPKVLTALLVAGTGAAVLALMEYSRVAFVVDRLRPFRADFTWVGAQLRAGGPFHYPSIASMYFEIVFACGLGLWAVERKRAGGEWTAPLLFGSLLVVADAVIVSYTRTGLVTIGVAVVVVGAMRYRRWGFDSGTTLVASLVMAIGLLALTSRPTQSLWLRFTTEGQESWYRMSVEAPQEITFSPDEILTIPVAVTNLGRVTWDSRVDPPFTLSSHWYDADGARVVAFYGIRNVFPAPVKSGETVTLDARVRAPREAGRYQLAWDIEYRNRLWFSTEQGASPQVSRAIVTGVAAAAAAAPRADVPRTAERPGRLVLWRAAARMFLARPLIGFGPDNYRLAYGSYAGLAHADDRVHSNNMYLELAVGAGLAGAAAFAWLFWNVARLAGQLILAPRGRDAAVGFGIAAAIASIALHGLVDSFLTFTSTYVVFAIVLGCAVALTGQGPAHADRV